MSTSYQCDYLERNALPPAFTSEQAELAHIDAKIRSLDQHLSQLTSLRNALLYRSRQLHNLLQPIQNLPFDIMSSIFQELVDVGRHDYPDIDWYEESIRQALVLCSVSSHFRNIAFNISALWRRVPLRVSEIEAIGKASSLLQHCLALAPSVDLAVIQPDNEEEARLAFDALLTPDTTRKIKSFGVAETFLENIPPSVWIDKFHAFRSPKFDTLSIYLQAEPISFDIQMLTTVTRLSVYAPTRGYSITIPPSVRQLKIDCIDGEVLVSLLHQCQNVIECDILTEYQLFTSSDIDTIIPEPLFLPNLRRLSSPGTITRCHSLTQKIRLSSLEFLHLRSLERYESTGALLLCRSVSSTLTTLKITVDDSEDSEDELNYDLFFQLCRIPFPKLRKLVIHSSYPLHLLTHVLELLEEEPPNSQLKCFPSLESVMWSTENAHYSELLDFLKAPRLGRAFCLHIQIYWCESHLDRPWLHGLLKKVIDGRQIEVRILKIVQYNPFNTW